MPVDSFEVAAQHARRTSGAGRVTSGPTHWSYFDEPWKALCGERIEPEQFARDPSCPECQAALRRIQDEDIR